MVDPAIILALQRLENGFFFGFPCFFERILSKTVGVRNPIRSLFPLC